MASCFCAICGAELSAFPCRLQQPPQLNECFVGHRAPFKVASKQLSGLNNMKTLKSTPWRNLAWGFTVIALCIGGAAAYSVDWHAVQRLQDEAMEQHLGRQQRQLGGLRGAAAVVNDRPRLLAASLANFTGSVNGTVLPSRMSSGALHNCAILDRGVVCWGRSGEDGRLGYDTASYGDDAVLEDGGVETPYSCSNSSDLSSQEAIDFGTTSHVVQVSAGSASEFSCVRFEDGRAKCWGQNDFGQLGADLASANTTELSVADIPFVALAAPQTGGGVQFITQVSAGRDHACAVTLGGEIHCWGSATLGSLGLLDTVNRGTETNSVASGGAVSVLGGPSVTQFVFVEAGQLVTCAVSTRGQAVCWGYATQGALGQGAPPGTGAAVGDEPGDFDNLLPLELGEPVVAIEADFTVCALLLSGTVKCWGVTGAGLGTDGVGVSGASTSIAVQVGSPQPSVKSVGVFASGACVITEAGQSKCWGRNFDGHLVAPGRNAEVGTAANTVAGHPFVDFGVLPAGWSVVEQAVSSEGICVRLAESYSSPVFAIRCWGTNRGCRFGLPDTTTSVVVGQDGTFPEVAQQPNTLLVAASPSPSATVSPTPSGSVSPSPSVSGSPTPTHSPSPSPSLSGTPSASVSPSPLTTPSATASATALASAPTASPSPSPSAAATDLTSPPGTGNPAGGAQQSGGGDDGLNTGAIAGIAVAAVVVVAGAVGLVMWLNARKGPPKRSARAVEVTSVMPAAISS